ncbi:n-acetyltransferase domain-containing protein [Trichonephila clavata]|uniref:N-acetyltransferase domain-containing protein n=1 Tax=Trichonephila clavata TaxID=2740835 RepID=A0A8X6GDA5_TRICU|nr:n-acetyltransferase domain-containing protein [Trichonephila clavata]
MEGGLKQTPHTAFKIRPMRTDEIPQVVKLTSGYNFQYTLPTIKFWHTHDHDGMNIAVTESGEIIGSLFNAKNTESVYVGGVFCVPEKYRHLDIARKLLKACFVHSQGKNFVGNTKIDVVGAYIGGGSNILESDWKSLEYETNTPVNPAILLDELPRGVEILSFKKSLLPAIMP